MTAADKLRKLADEPLESPWFEDETVEMLARLLAQTVEALDEVTIWWSDRESPLEKALAAVDEFAEKLP